MRLSLILLTSLLLGLFPSCMKTTIIGAPIEEKADTVMTKKPQKDFAPKDTTNTSDTIRVPINFNVTVEEWEETDIDM